MTPIEKLKHEIMDLSTSEKLITAAALIDAGGHTRVAAAVVQLALAEICEKIGTDGQRENS